MILNFYKNNKWLSIAILLGAIIRILFLLFGSEIYFNRPNIFIDGDTWAWQNCIENLINKGTYTVGGDKGKFSRMPGYSFFMGAFYLISGKDWNIAVIIIGWFQTLLNTGLGIICNNSKELEDKLRMIIKSYLKTHKIELSLNKDAVKSYSRRSQTKSLALILKNMSNE